MRNLVDILDLTTEEIDGLVRLGSDIMDNPEKYAECCRGKILATLFFEPSTRTRLSFTCKGGLRFHIPVFKKCNEGVGIHVAVSNARLKAFGFDGDRRRFRWLFHKHADAIFAYDLHSVNDIRFGGKANDGYRQCKEECYHAFHVSNCIKKRALFRLHRKCSWISIAYCPN